MTEPMFSELFHREYAAQIGDDFRMIVSVQGESVLDLSKEDALKLADLIYYNYGKPSHCKVAGRLSMAQSLVDEKYGDMLDGMDMDSYLTAVTTLAAEIGAQERHDESHERVYESLRTGITVEWPTPSSFVPMPLSEEGDTREMPQRTKPVRIADQPPSYG